MLLLASCRGRTLLHVVEKSVRFSRFKFHRNIGSSIFNFCRCAVAFFVKIILKWRERPRAGGGGGSFIGK